MIRPFAFLALLVSALSLPRPGGAAAQTATVAEPGPAAERYHEAARLYVDGDLAAAGRAADAGLALAPADARMRALHELIRREQPEDGGGGDDEQPPPPPGGGGEDDGETEPEPDGQDAPPEGPPDDAPPASDRPPAPQDGPGSGAPERPGQMTPEQAERLLDAVGGEEQLLLRSMRREPTRVRQNEKTW